MQRHSSRVSLTVFTTHSGQSTTDDFHKEDCTSKAGGSGPAQRVKALKVHLPLDVTILTKSSTQSLSLAIPMIKVRLSPVTLKFLVDWAHHLSSWCFSSSHLVNGNSTSYLPTPLQWCTQDTQRDWSTAPHQRRTACAVTPTKEHWGPQKCVNSNPAAIFQLLDLRLVHFNRNHPLTFLLITRPMSSSSQSRHFILIHIMKACPMVSNVKCKPPPFPPRSKSDDSDSVPAVQAWVQVPSNHIKAPCPGT